MTGSKGMIRYRTKNTPIGESLVGKYVFRDGVTHFMSYSQLRIVVAESGKSVVMRKVAHVTDAETGATRITGPNDARADEDEKVVASVIRCICDTAAEAAAVYEAGRASQRLWSDGIAQAKKLFADLEGVSIDDEPEIALSEAAPRP
jgi:hypothetical protein